MQVNGKNPFQIIALSNGAANSYPRGAIKRLLGQILLPTLLVAAASPILAAQMPETNVASVQSAMWSTIPPTSDPADKPQTWGQLQRDQLDLRSAAVLIVDDTGNRVYGKRAEIPMPIASITKLMTAMVILDAKLPMDAAITITKADRDLLRLTGSRLKFGASLSRREMLLLALMASENRAASALARTFPGGSRALIARLNSKAKSLGMKHSRFVDATGLNSGNISTASDLARLVKTAFSYPFIRAATTRGSLSVRPYKKRGPLVYHNTNRLIRNSHWTIGLSKTGYINESGRCLVMQAVIADRSLYIVLLNSFGKLTPFGDSNRIRKWIEAGIEQT